MLIQIFLLILAIVILYYGAEFTLESSEKIGQILGMSSLVIGLLIVGFGTSLPEFFVSQLAAVNGEYGIAMGNIVGSNIANTFLILGVSGLLATLNFKSSEIKKQFLFHFVLTGLLLLILFLRELNWWNAGLLGVFFCYYLYYTFSKMSNNQDNADYEQEEKLSFILIVKLLVGFILLYFGGKLLVTSGSSLATSLGVSSYIISAIFIAFGTSFPELVTAILACYRKKDTDLIIGNIVGSNIFNVAFVLASLVGHQIKIETFFRNEMIALLFGASFFILLSFLKRNFYRIEGGIFLLIYFVMVYLWV